MKPEQFLKMTKEYERNLKSAKANDLVVGLTKSSAGQKVYKSGESLINVGFMQEYGTDTIPPRSFLRMPLAVKRKKIIAAMDQQFERLLQGGDFNDLLELTGVAALNVVDGAFTTKGYGKWPDIKQSTKNAKGKSNPLIDTGLLRGSITWEVRRAA